MEPGKESTAEKALYEALAKARLVMEPIKHDDRNEHFGYTYTSAETIIEKGTKCLAQHGLALIPIHHEVAPTEWQRPLPPDGTTDSKGRAPAYFQRFKVSTQWLLVHSAGGCVKMVKEAVAQAEPGQTEAKANFVASTQLLAYLIRDLLGLARPDSHDGQQAPPRGGGYARAAHGRNAAGANVGQPQGSQQAPYDGTFQDVITRKAEKKEKTHDGKDIVRWGFLCNDHDIWVNTYDTSLAKQCLEAKDAGELVAITVKKDGNFRRLVGIQPVTDDQQSDSNTPLPPADPDDPGTDDVF